MESSIETYQFQGITVELRSNPRGAGGHLPPHFHSEYQIILTQHTTEVYQYRRARHVASEGSLVVLHPGEVHSASGLHDSQPFVPLRTMLISPDTIWPAEGKPFQRHSSPLPFFAEPILRGCVFSEFLHCHTLLESSASTLEKEVKLLAALLHLLAHSSAAGNHRPDPKPERAAVQRVREYLEDHCAQDVSLDRLACVAGLSPSHLCRVFRQEIGLPPHVYQTQVRLARAKSLLALGMPIGEVAASTGFADQSHFTRHFRRVLGVTPGRYRRRG